MAGGSTGLLDAVGARASNSVLAAARGIGGARLPVPAHIVKVRRGGITRMLWQIP